MEAADAMTDYQFKTLLKMVLEILDSGKDIEEAKAAIRKLLGKEDQQ